MFSLLSGEFLLTVWTGPVCRVARARTVARRPLGSPVRSSAGSAALVAPGRSYPDAVSESPQDADARPAQAPGGRSTRLLAFATCSLQALAVLGWAVFEVVRAGSGRTSTVGVAVALGGLLVVFAAALVLMALGWRRGAGWQKTPTVVWNILLLPVAWSLVQGGSTLLGLVVGVVALVGLAAAVATPTTFGPDPDDGPDPADSAERGS